MFLIQGQLKNQSDLGGIYDPGEDQHRDSSSSKLNLQQWSWKAAISDRYIIPSPASVCVHSFITNRVCRSCWTMSEICYFVSELSCLCDSRLLKSI